jgi:type II secretory pathway pseudopilin PulG
MMLELLIAITVMSVALTALIIVFTSSLIVMRQSSQATTATFIADAQMEAYRAMTSRDIGVDLSAGAISALDSTYTSDPACANASTSKTCAANGVAATETGPTGATPHTCAQINTWYPNTLPCNESRTITGSTTPASPDYHTYRVDTYITPLAATQSGTLYRTRKQVTVVVRDGAQLGRVFVRETSIFDCSTGITPGSTDC